MLASAGDEELVDSPEGTVPAEALDGVRGVRVLGERVPLAEVADVGDVPERGENAAELADAAQPEVPAACACGPAFDTLGRGEYPRAGVVEAVDGADECLYGYGPLAGGSAAGERDEYGYDAAR